MEVPDVDAGGAELSEGFFDVFSDYGWLVRARCEGVELCWVLASLEEERIGGEERTLVATLNPDSFQPACLIQFSFSPS